MEYIEKNKDITAFSNFKVPTRAKYFFELTSKENIDKVYEIYSWAKSQKFPILFISGGTNMLFAFDRYEGVVIKNSLCGWNYDRETCVLECSSADYIWEVAESLEKEYNQGLWHRFIGLPGSIAGAIYGNAGCFGLETENNFLDCKVLNLEDGQLSTFTKKEMSFSYRSSRLKEEKKYFIISARFDLSQKVEKYHSDADNIFFREHKQPNGMSCGSFFKNPSREQSAGYLIESVGLKGYQIGGAFFSEKHANFLMHDGTGNYKDFLELIELAQKKVQEEFRVHLENEVQIISNNKINSCEK